MQKVGKIIREIRKQRGMSQSHLARSAELSISYMNCIEQENENTDNIGLATLEKIANVLGVNLTDLFAATAAQENDAGALKQIISIIPIMGYVGTHKYKQHLLWDNDGMPTGEPITAIQHITELDDPKAYAVIVKDDKMEPVKTDWLLVVSPKQKVKNNDLVLFVVGGTAYFRRVQINNDIYIFNGFTSMVESMVFNRTQIQVLHKVWALRAP